MNAKRLTVITALLIVLALSVSLTGAQDDNADDFQTDYHLRGTIVQRIGQYPDAFSYDGSDIEVVGDVGFFELHVDAANDVGLMFARIYFEEYQLDAETTLEDVEFTVFYPLFGNPIAMPDYWEGGIANDLLLHGDSGAEAPVLPTVWNAVASWGPALVFVNGEQYFAGAELISEDNPLGWMDGHMMFSSMVRNPETGEVFNAAGDGYFSPMTPGDGIAYEEGDASLLHLVVHSTERDDNAFPPFTSFIHINFLDIEEIDPIEDLEFLTFDDLADLDDEAIEAWIDYWFELTDTVDDELFGEAES